LLTKRRADIAECWSEIALENPDLLGKLHQVEMKTPGFSTVVVPSQGFSENDDVHNSVISFLRANRVTLLNPAREEYELSRALHGRNRKIDI